MSLWRSNTCPSASITGGQSAMFHPPSIIGFSLRADRITTPGRVNLLRASRTSSPRIGRYLEKKLWDLKLKP
jgi:hypothetical protein